MTTDLRGIPLLDAVIEEIKAHPERHYQRGYVTRTPCGTAFCVAGWAVVLVYGEDSIRWGDEEDEDTWGCWIPGRGGRPEPTGIDVAAQRLLKLSGRESLYLFRGSNTFDDIMRIRDEIVEVSA